MEGLTKTLSRLPIIPLAIFYGLYLGYNYYDWMNNPESELGQRKAAVVSAKTELDVQKKKLAQGEEFYKNLDALRARIRKLTADLDGSKATLSAEIDIANFVRLITLEAKKLGIVIKGIKPETDAKKEYYVEVPYSVAFRGAYVQTLVFFDRIAKFQQVIRISDFEMRPSGNVFTKYVELEGRVKLLAYRYLGTGADEVQNKAEMKSESTPGGAAAPGGGK